MALIFYSDNISLILETNFGSQLCFFSILIIKVNSMPSTWTYATLKSSSEWERYKYDVKQYHCFILLWFYVLERNDFSRRESYSKIYLRLLISDFLFFSSSFLNLPQIFHLCTYGWHHKIVENKEKGWKKERQNSLCCFLFLQDWSVQVFVIESFLFWKLLTEREDALGLFW